MKIGPCLEGKFTRRNRQVNGDSHASHENQISINTVIHEKGTDRTCWNILIPWTSSGINFSRMFTKFVFCPPFWQSHTHTHTYQPSPQGPSNIRAYCTANRLVCQSFLRRKALTLAVWVRVLYLWKKLPEKICRSREKYKPLSLPTDGHLLGV